MNKFIKKIGFLALFLTVSSSLIGYEGGNRLYVGAFGGGLYSNKTKMSQQGTAFFTEAEGGPLAVNARGSTRKTSTGFGGIQVGYEWRDCPWQFGCSDFSLTPGVEAEAYWYRHTKKGDLINETNRLPEHDFLNKFPMNVGVYLVNGSLSFNHCALGQFTPYVAGGIGAARIRIHNADSLQVDPIEAGINHFNNDRSDTSWTFAAQAKVGLRYEISCRFHIFAEYRFLYLDTTDYVFGSTNYPDHAPTSPWNVKAKDIWYNAFAIGLQYDL